jgi:hypothetical protein
VTEVIFCVRGVITAPCGVPTLLSDHWPSSDIPALSHFWDQAQDPAIGYAVLNKLHRPFVVEDGHYGLLYDLVFQRRDGQRELHLSTVSIWDGRRSVTRFIRFEVNVSKCSKRDASLASTR